MKTTRDVVQSILLLIINLQAVVNANDELLLIPDDPKAVVGESLVMWCSAISKDTSLTSEDLEIVLELPNGSVHTIDSQYVHTMNETTIELNYPNLPLALHNVHVICRQKNFSGESGLHDVQRLWIGFRPFEPVILKDYKVYNWEVFDFKWTMNDTDPVYSTRYEAWFRTSSDVEFTKCSGGERTSPRQKGNSCKIPKALDLVHPNGFLWIKVNGSNAVGEVTSAVSKVQLYNVVQPGKIDNIIVNSSVSSGVMAEFYPPKREKSLKYRISVTCGKITLPEILIRNASYSKYPVRWKLELPFPPYTECHLSISCLPFYNREYWSEWSDKINFTSPDGVPQSGPPVCCFEVLPRNANIRDVTIYFKHLMNREAQGQVVQYVVRSVTSGNELILSYTNETKINPQKSLFSLGLYNEANYSISIIAETRAGRNESAVSVLFVPGQEDVLSFPRNVTAIWYGPKTVRVSWEQKSFNYTIVWCQNYFKCEESVRWMVTSCSSYQDVELPVGETSSYYRFGIAVSLFPMRNSGIKWLDCMYNISAEALAPTVTLINKTSTTIFLHLGKADCSGKNRGFIYEHRIYCNSTQEKETTLTRSHSELDASNGLIMIDDLEPDSDYRFRVAALTASGPSEETIITERTSSTGKLKPVWLVIIAVAAIIALAFVLVGVYTCCKCYKDQCLKIKSWLNMEITVPEKQTLDMRGVADGLNSPSYINLSKSQDSMSTESEHLMQNLSDDRVEHEQLSKYTEDLKTEYHSQQSETSFAHQVEQPLMNADRGQVTQHGVVINNRQSTSALAGESHLQNSAPNGSMDQRRIDLPDETSSSLPDRLPRKSSVKNSHVAESETNSNTTSVDSCETEQTLLSIPYTGSASLGSETQTQQLDEAISNNASDQRTNLNLSSSENDVEDYSCARFADDSPTLEESAYSAETSPYSYAVGNETVENDSGSFSSYAMSVLSEANEAQQQHLLENDSNSNSQEQEEEEEEEQNSAGYSRASMLMKSK